jgi:hypothetical protein
LKALEDPAARKGGSANVLDRQSFPALLIFGIDNADLSPIILTDFDGCEYVFEPVLELSQTTRWNPLDRKLFSFSKNDWWYPGDWFNPRYSERDRAADALRVADKFQALDRWLKAEETWISLYNNQNYETTEIDSYAGILRTIKQRREALEYLVNGSVSQQRLPLEFLAPDPKKCKVPKLPQVADVLPEEITVNAGQTTPIRFALLGSGLGNLKKEDIQLLTATSTAGKVTDVSATADGSLLVDALLDNPATFVFRLKVSDGGFAAGIPGQDPAILSPPVKVTVIPTPSPAPNLTPIIRTTVKTGKPENDSDLVISGDKSNPEVVKRALNDSTEAVRERINIPLNDARIRLDAPRAP